MEVYMALIDTYRKNIIRKREEIVKLVSDKAKEKVKLQKQELRLIMQMLQ